MGIQAIEKRHRAWGLIRLGLVIGVIVATAAPATATMPAQDVDLLDGLVAYWPMDETAGIRYDVHGGHDLTDNNTVGYATGVIGNASYAANANSEYLSANNAVDSSTITLFGWFKGSGSSIQVAKFTTDYGVINVTISSGYAAIYIYEVYGDECEFEDNAIAQISPTSWRLIIFEHDRASHTSHVWIDGELVMDVDWSSCDYLPDEAENDIEMLRYYDSYADEIGIYNRALTDDERSALYNNGAGIPYSDFAQRSRSVLSGAISYWSLDEASGTRLDGISTNNLTASGAPGSESGMIGPAASFDGTDDYLYLSSGNVITDNESFTVFSWVGIDETCETDNDCPIMSAWGTGYPSREWRINFFSGYINADVQTTSGVIPIYIQATPTDWHAVALSYNATTEYCTLFVDDESQIVACPNANMATTSQLRLASDGLGYMDGSIDEALLLDHAITQDEFNDLYANGWGITYDELERKIGGDYLAFLPVIKHGNVTPSTDACSLTVCDEGEHCLDGECIPDDDIQTIIPIDYESASWREWADMIDALLAPIFEQIDTTIKAISEAQTESCGHIGPSDEFVPSSDDPQFYDGQTLLDRVYNMGLAMGKPMAYMNVLRSSGVFGLNYLTVLLGYFGAVLLVITFIAAISLTVRIIRGAAQLIKWIYEMIPFKST